MMDREGEQCTFTMSGKKEVDISLRPAEAQECSMCGDVGFANQLHQCTVCQFRYQHTYCCTSTEGLRTGTWVCDWCRLLKKEKTFDGKGVRAAGGACSVLCDRTGGLEVLLMAALNEAQHTAGIETSSGDGGSLCSSSIESSKENESSPGVLQASSCCCSSEDMISQGEETRPKFSGAIRGIGTCHPQKNRKLARSGSQKTQKSLLEQQCSSVQLKRPPLRSTKTEGAYDPPKSCVRRYKSLSKIVHSSYAGTLPSF